MNHFKQTNLLRPNCSDISLYECLEADLVGAQKLCGHCGGLCEVVSLPHDLLLKCKSVEQFECSKDVFMQKITDENNECRNQRSCTDLIYDLQAVKVKEKVIGFESDLLLNPDRWHQTKPF